MQDEPVADLPSTSSPLVSITIRQLVFVLLIGLFVGVVMWGLTELINGYVLAPIFCRDGKGSACASLPRYSEAAAVVLASGIGLFGLVRLGIFRPLLVALASAVSLWGIVGYTSGFFPWYYVLASSALLYALAYGAYMWLTRIRLFWVAVILILILVVALRLLFS